MKIRFFLCSLLIFSISVIAQNFYKGADLSFVKELEGCGVKWKENNKEEDIFKIFKDKGSNIVRFRIWHTPKNGRNGYSDCEALFARAKTAGFKIVLDFHYSDTWTDPSNQLVPEAWKKVVDNPAALSDSIYNYTKKVLSTLKQKNLMPDFVQVGNETNGGMCFGNDGKVTWPTDWNKQKRLYNAGIKAVREIDSKCKIILHQADPGVTEWWVGELNKNGVTDYDILGISFYPTIHTTKTINDVGAIISNVKQMYKKDVMIVETALPWTDTWDDTVRNMMNTVPSGYGSKPSPEIQAKWLTDLSKKVQSSGGIGIIYWEPDWVASHKVNCVSAYGGSTWENMTFFDFDNNLIDKGGIQFIGTVTDVRNEKSSYIRKNLKINKISSEKISLRINENDACKIKLQVLTLHGRLISSSEFSAQAGENDLLFSIGKCKNLTSICIVRITDKNMCYSQLVTLE